MREGGEYGWTGLDGSSSGSGRWVQRCDVMCAEVLGLSGYLGWKFFQARRGCLACLFGGGGCNERRLRFLTMRMACMT